jgi:hypothetical protein
MKNKKQATKKTKQKREGLIGFMLGGILIEMVVEILRERDLGQARQVLMRRPRQRQPKWILGHDIVEIQRVPRAPDLPASPKPLTRAELREYNKLFHQWTKNGGAGAEELSPEKIARFAELSERLSLTGIQM